MVKRSFAKALFSGLAPDLKVMQIEIQSMMIPQSQSRARLEIN